MKLDIRTPIGGMFLVDGLILIGYGLFGHPDMARTQGTNINLLWGAAMAIFGGTMLTFAILARKNAGTAGPQAASSGAPPRSMH